MSPEGDLFTVKFEPVRNRGYFSISLKTGTAKRPYVDVVHDYEEFRRLYLRRIKFLLYDNVVISKNDQVKVAAIVSPGTPFWRVFLTLGPRDAPPHGADSTIHREGS